MHKPINGFSKEKIIKVIQMRMLDHQSYHGGYCRYKAPDGNRCAVGVFIPNGHKSESSTLAVDRLLEKYSDLLDKMPLGKVGMTVLQIVHDQSRNVDPRPAIIDWVQKHVE